MFGKVNKTTGDVSEIAGLGELVPSVSLYQSGSFEVAALPADAYTETGAISFQTPFPDTDYIVTFDFAHSSLVGGAIEKSASSFKVVIGNVDPDAGTNPSICYWKAFKLMTDQQTALDEAQITKNKNNTAATFSTSTSYAVGSYCIHDGHLYRCIVPHSGAWDGSHFTATNVTNAVARYNDAILTPGYFSTSVLADIKATADAVADYKMFQGDTQSGVEASWFGFKKTSTYWHCTIWDGHGLVSHLVYKNGTYTCNVIHEGAHNQ